MSLTCPGPLACQCNREKASNPLRQNQYNSKPHTTHEKHGTSAKGNPPTDNQPAPHATEDKKNDIFPIPAAVLWQGLIKKTVFFSTKFSLDQRKHLGIPSMCYKEPERSRGCVPSLQSTDTFLR